jgi:hypothetical protein
MFYDSFTWILVVYVKESNQFKNNIKFLVNSICNNAGIKKNDFSVMNKENN